LISLFVWIEGKRVLLLDLLKHLLTGFIIDFNILGDVSDCPLHLLRIPTIEFEIEVFFLVVEEHGQKPNAVKTSYLALFYFLGFLA
jgi:hypothetical protein